MKRLAGYLFAFSLIACSNRKDVPKDIIPQDSMQKIMMEIIMAQEYSNQYIAKDSLKPDKVKANQDLLEGIFKIHHLTKSAFSKSLHYYESRPDLNKMIFDSLSVYANKHRAELYAPKEPVKRRLDTLK